MGQQLHFAIRALEPDENDCVHVDWRYYTSEEDEDQGDVLSKKPSRLGYYIYDFSQLPKEDLPENLCAAAELMAAQDLIFHDPKRSPVLSKKGTNLSVDGYGAHFHFSRGDCVALVGKREGGPKDRMLGRLSASLYCALYSAQVDARGSAAYAVESNKKPLSRKFILDDALWLKYQKPFEIYSKSIGVLHITRHAMQRYASRLNLTTHSRKEVERPFWSLYRLLTQAVFRRMEITNDQVIEHKRKKYEQLYDKTAFWKAEVKDLYLVTVPSAIWPRANVLVTVFYRPKNMADLKIRRVREA